MKKVYQCDHCGKTFDNKDACQIHEAGHLVMPLSTTGIYCRGYGNREDQDRRYPTVLDVQMNDGAVGIYELIQIVKKK